MGVKRLKIWIASQSSKQQTDLLDICLWLCVLTVGKVETWCLVSAVTCEHVVGKLPTLCLSGSSTRCDCCAIFLKTALEHLLFFSMALSPSYCCHLQTGISHCVAIRSLSVFQSSLVEKTEWLIKKTLSIYFGGWMYRSALMSDLRNPSFIKKELAHCWLRTKCNFCICITKTRLIDLIWGSSWVCCLFALNCSCLVATVMPSSFPIDITWRQRSSPRITGQASRGNSSLM